MNRRHYLIAGMVLAAQIIALISGDNLLAADCKVLYEKIRTERTLMKKKDLALEAVKACPADAAIVYEYGYTMERLRKYEDALQQYKKAVELDPAYAKAYFSVGDIQALLRNYREAVVAYQFGLQYDVDDDRAKASLKDVRAKYKEMTGNDAPVPPPPIKKTVVAAKGKSAESTNAPGEIRKETKVAPAPAASYAEAPIVRLQVPFYKQSTSLSDEARDVLAVVVGQALGRPDMKDVRYEIGGHTDDLGDPSKNEEISRVRAEVVKAYLVDNFGISADRLTVSAHGQKLPMVPNTSPANQELNRRVEFTRIN